MTNYIIIYRDEELQWTFSDAKLQPGPQKPNRIRRDCPVPGCLASVLKLSQHLQQKHQLPPAERQRLLNIAKTVLPTRRITPKMKMAAEERSITESIGSTRRAGTTRNFGQHPIDTGILNDYTQWLMSIDGKERSRSQAVQNAVDISKYLHFCNDNDVEPCSAYDPAKFNNYLTTLKDTGITAAGILVKILRLRNFLDFLTNDMDPSSQDYAKVQRMITKLKAWHSHFAKQKYKVKSITYKRFRVMVILPKCTV